MADKVIPVKVVLRCRPLNTKESSSGCQQCVEFIPNEPQVVLGKDKAFTYDKVFDSDSAQGDVYLSTVQPLIKNIFKGYNVTCLAYGQTGSGKTFTMGTACFDDYKGETEMVGIIPRALKEIFEFIDKSSDREFNIKVSFLEIYKEEINDLLHKKVPGQQPPDLMIRESTKEGILINGLTEISVTNYEETIVQLKTGAVERSTGSTAMNQHSSRSHAIFTLSVEQKRNNNKDVVRSKFHLVDLAGSERCKKTGAQGERFKEGVNINLGLLALGNVISALCDDQNHVPYRESKLTRLLQDSLGGNSHTVMIACISPADMNFEETLNTLRYADRARKIKNKPIINRDPVAAELARLRELVQQLQGNIVIEGVRSIQGSSGEVDKEMALKNKGLELENKKLTKELQLALEETASLSEKAVMAESARDKMKQKLEELKQKSKATINKLNESVETEVGMTMGYDHVHLVKGIQEKILEMEEEQIQCDKEMKILTDSYRCQNTDAEKGDAETVSGEKDVQNTEMDEYTSTYTMKQALLNRELRELNQALLMKEDLISQAQMNDLEYCVMKMNYENKVKEIEEQLTVLQKEKEDLNAALKNVQVSTASTKISEQRRKRLQELETELSSLKKKHQEVARVAKMKEQSDEKILKLKEDVTNMKSARVKLIRQMRSDSDQFRQWKLQKEQEVSRLKQQDRRRQFQMTQLQQKHHKQETVMKRKMEEAMSANKRLKDALAKRVTALENRKLKNADGENARIRNWLSQELDVVVGVKEATFHLEALVEDRQTINEELAKLRQMKETYEPARKKRRSGRNDSSEDSQDDDEIVTKILKLESELALRNAQISDLQQKILDADQGQQRLKQRWDAVQNMQDAKQAMKFLFEELVNNKSEGSLKSSEFVDMKSSVQELSQSVSQLQSDLKEERAQFQLKLIKQEKESEERIHFLLRQLPKAGASQDMDVSAQDQKTLIDMEVDNLRALNEAKEQEIVNLRKEIQNTSRGPVAEKKMSFASKPKKKSSVLLMESLTTDEEDLSDNSDNDPDWKQTPIYKRIHSLRNTMKTLPLSQRISDSDDDDDSFKENDEISRKRSSTSSKGCGCPKGTCSNRQCSCKKKDAVCSDDCGCSEDRCKNRNATTVSTLKEETTSTTLDATFSVDGSELVKAERSTILQPLIPNIDGHGEFKTPKRYFTPLTLKRVADAKFECLEDF